MTLLTLLHQPATGGGGGGGGTATTSVGAANDDGYVNDFGGYSSAAGSMYFGYDVSELHMNLWLRMPLAVAQGATISSATLTINSVPVEGSPVMTVSASAEDNVATLVSPASQVAAKTRTTANAGWSPTGSGDSTVNVTTVIAELVARGGWVSGNYLMFLVDTAITTVGVDNEMQYIGYNDNPSLAARLSVTYGSGSSPVAFVGWGMPL